MPALTATQITNINSTIDQVQSYIDQLQGALAAAANSGNTATATTIEGYYDQALELESSLKALLTISTAAGLQPAVQAINGTVTTLQNQKTMIDNAVNAVGIASTVLADIVGIAAAVAAIV